MGLQLCPGVAQSAIIKARVEPEIAEAFSLAATLDGTTVSVALRRAINAYIAASAAGLKNEDGRPAQEPDGRGNPATYAHATIPGGARET